VALSPSQIERYARHILLDEVGAGGQERLLGASIRLRGAGLAAEEAARYLSAAGVGTLVLDRALLDDQGRALGDLNPEVRLLAQGETHTTLELADDPSRLRGARAALESLVAIAVGGAS
jgi:hypothetical protein